MTPKQIRQFAIGRGLASGPRAVARARRNRNRGESITRVVFPAAAGVLLAGILTGCAASDSVAQQYRDGNDKDYIVSDFQVVEIPVER
ncbi:hypothetical protein [Microbacterium sp. CH12i]|uniref:hypothetical protein n=1 Tax=Microbacterium sp. CH12i TaxID=1479651 RepID=UPI001268F2C6|nr:hypothetical protein [Microbacterium sp. CH12i]